MIDILLQPYTKYIKSYIKDTKDFLQKLPHEISNDSILASFDVESLYSNFPHDLDLEAITFWINKYPREFSSRISEEFILAYLEEKMYEQSEKDFDSDFRKYIKTNFKRFLDDCFLIFT